MDPWHLDGHSVLVSLNRGISKLRPVAQNAHWRRKRWHQGLRQNSLGEKKSLKKKNLARETFNTFNFEPKTHVSEVSHPGSATFSQALPGFFGTCSSPFDTPHNSRKFNSCELPGRSGFCELLETNVTIYWIYWIYWLQSMYTSHTDACSIH